MEMLSYSCILELSDLNAIEPYFYKINNTEEFSCYINPRRKVLMLYDKLTQIINIISSEDNKISDLEFDSGLSFDWN